jgi:uncharacterized protein (DUF2235 family)
MSKKIVVFADGTGNAFTTQESNVWRLYCALDQTNPDQIAHYIEGVGTSGFRPFALLDGATGIGVPSNVRKLYQFISWNWQRGDEIYMFGFSRGAFTIRTLVGLIHSEGLIPHCFSKTPDQSGQDAAQGDMEPASHAEMRRNARAAWRSYRSKGPTSWRDTFITIKIARFIRDIVLGIVHLLGRVLFGHRLYATVAGATKAQKRDEIPITFVGLFDTVEAFGVPIEEFRKAIDFAIWPISFRNTVLSNRVLCARHALSLDDERRTFYPVRFDRVKSEHPERIKEVWFAGVHSDVGGGYPDGDLAYVPLRWMMGEIGDGLQYMPGAREALADKASAFAPTHDSRGGLSVFYRYAPREVDANGGAPVIHHSVAEKIAFGAERYAPVTLPDTARVLMPDGSLHDIKGFDRERFAQNKTAISPADQVAANAVHALNDPSPAIVSLTRDAVWKRRVAYYFLLIAAAVIASLPWTVRPAVSWFRDEVRGLLSVVGLGEWWDAKWQTLANADQGWSAWLGAVFQYVGSMLPGYAKPWSDALIDRPTVCGIVIALTVYLYMKNASLRDSIADLARQAWMPLARTEHVEKRTSEAAIKPTFASRMRTSAFANWVSNVTSQRVLPFAGVLLIFAAIGVSVSRSTVAFREGRGGICRATKDQNQTRTPELGQSVTQEGFRTDQLCWASTLNVRKGGHYQLKIEMTEPFFDKTIMTDIAGFKDPLSWRHGPTQFVLRWWTADWFQPVAKIGPTGSDTWPLESADGDTALPAGTDASKLRKTLVSRFTATADGELMLYVNDAIVAIPFVETIKTFYANNSGTAKVTLKRLSAEAGG